MSEAIRKRIFGLTHPCAEAMPDGARLTALCHAADEAAGAIEALEAENQRLRHALSRLGSAECFGNGGILGRVITSLPNGDEIAARMDYARKTLEQGK